ncbi:J domain-containing protein [Psychromicrobium sp. YIM B11713]|uniref:J domain-containing protein n=1 Tax=Psychromicrobium sp. YIM B11713 TaxID=3145233 RepID=UPI00374F745E
MKSTDRNCYDVLGVTSDSSIDEIKKSYRKLMRQIHTDLNRGSSHDLVAELNNAYAVLINPEKRKQYDEQVKDFGAADGGTNSSPSDEEPLWGEERSWDEPPIRKTRETVVNPSPDFPHYSKVFVQNAWTPEHHKAQKIIYRQIQQVLAAATAAAFLGYFVPAFFSPIFLPPKNNTAILYGTNVVLPLILVTLLSAWLVLRKKTPYIGYLFTAIYLANEFSQLRNSTPLILTIGMVVALGVLRRKKISYLSTYKNAMDWENFENRVRSLGHPLLFIAQSTPVFNGQKTNALVRHDATGIPETLWIWGWFPAGNWIDYDRRSQTVLSWANATNLTAWHQLNDKLKTA